VGVVSSCGNVIPRAARRCRLDALPHGEDTPHCAVDARKRNKKGAVRSYPSPLFVTLPYPFAMQDRPRRLGKVAVAGRPVALTPGATMGMPVGVQVPEPQPAAIVTARMGTTMPGGVKHTRAAMGRRHGSGAERGGLWAPSPRVHRRHSGVLASDPRRLWARWRVCACTAGGLVALTFGGTRWIGSASHHAT